MKEDRFLMGILIGIALLVLASLSVFFLRKDTQTYLEENTPQAVAHDYIFAVEQEDYERAYTYLAEDEHKPSYTTFLRDIVNTNSYSVQIGDAEISGKTASVQVIFANMSGDILGDRYEFTGTTLLVEQAGEWKLLNMSDYYYWHWDWYKEK